jgi:serine/threonine protein kinase
MAAVKVCPVCSREFAPALTHCPQDGVGLVALNTGAGARPEELVGQIVEGRYRVERIVGKGGMGTVYAVRHIVVGKVAAMKVLKTGVERADGVLQRFVREAQTANLVKSRHIVEITDFGQLTNGLFYVVMELLEGEDLTRAMKPGKLARADLVHIFVQVAEALALAHEKGIVHRDLKPDNVFLVNEGGDPRFVKLLDFGIAKVMAGDNASAGLTETGVILGTPYYMSPEQARAEVVDHRSDIYALGVMMYRAFTGRLPFVADSTMGVLTRHLTETPELPSRLNDVDPATERMIMRCMEKRREARYQSMTEVAEALRSIPLGAGAPSGQMREEATVDARGRGNPTGFGPAGLPGSAEPSYSGPQVMSQAIHAIQSGAAASGAYRPSVVPTYPSGAYPQPMVNGHNGPPPSYPGSAQMSSPPGGWPAHMSSPPGGAWPAAGPVSSGPSSGWPLVSSPPGNGWAAQPMATPGPMSEPHPGNGGPWPPGTTERGFVTSSLSGTSPRRGGALVIGVGALTMLAVGAVGAVLIYGRRPLPAPAAGASAEAPITASALPIAAPPPSAVVVVAPPPPIPSASAEPAASVASAAPTVAPIVGKRSGGSVPPSKPSATVPVKHGTDIRSPFD